MIAKTSGSVLTSGSDTNRDVPDEGVVWRTSDRECAPTRPSLPHQRTSTTIVAPMPSQESVLPPEWRKWTLRIRKLNGKLVSIFVTERSTIMDIHRVLWEQHGIHPDRQRLMWKGIRLEHELKLGELGVHEWDTLQLTRTLPGAHVLCIASWAGEIIGREKDLPTLNFDKGSILIAHKIVHPQWLLCSNEKGLIGLVPRTHIMILEIFRDTLLNELKNTSSDGRSLPEVSQPPDAERKFLKVVKFRTNTHPSLWRRPLLWLPTILRKQGPSSPPDETEGLRHRHYLQPWDHTLRSKYLKEAHSFTKDNTSPIRPPELPSLRRIHSRTKDSQSPLVDPDSTLVLNHGLDGIDGACVALEVSSCQLTSLEDVPTIHAFLKCLPSATERVSSVTVSFEFVDNNWALDLWPKEALGPTNDVEMVVKDNRVDKGKLNAAIAVDAVKLGGELEQERGKEVEKAFVMHSRTSIYGSIISREARWIMKEDGVQASGLPVETALRVNVRYKPREVRYAYAITLTKGSSAQHLTGKATLLFP